MQVLDVKIHGHVVGRRKRQRNVLRYRTEDGHVVIKDGCQRDAKILQRLRNCMFVVDKQKEQKDVIWYINVVDHLVKDVIIIIHVVVKGYTRQDVLEDVKIVQNSGEQDQDVSKPHRHWIFCKIITITEDWSGLTLRSCAGAVVRNKDLYLSTNSSVSGAFIYITPYCNKFYLRNI